MDNSRIGFGKSEGRCKLCRSVSLLFCCSTSAHLTFCGLSALLVTGDHPLFDPPLPKCWAICSFYEHGKREILVFPQTFLFLLFLLCLTTPPEIKHSRIQGTSQASPASKAISCFSRNFNFCLQGSPWICRVEQRVFVDAGGTQIFGNFSVFPPLLQDKAFIFHISPPSSCQVSIFF